MKRGDVLIVVVIAAVTGLSWSSSIAHDNDQIRAKSFAAGREWAQRTAAEPDSCEMEVLGRTGPELDSMAWREGCVAEAEANAVPPPPRPPVLPFPGVPPAPATPSPGLPAPR